MHKDMTIRNRPTDPGRNAWTAAVTLLVLGLFAASCDKVGVVEPVEEPMDTSDVVVRKPNLYLYPTEQTTFSVRLGFPGGGSVLASDPAYNDGWTVSVEPSGLIEGRYRYLFYEARTPDRYQYSAGWIIEGSTLEQFFRRVMAGAGFSDAETGDFIEYWVPLLSPDRSYIIYPQLQEQLDGLIRLRIAPEPDVLIRLFFVIRTLEGPAPALRTPVLPTPIRRGYVAAEWGVVLQ